MKIIKKSLLFLSCLVVLSLTAKQVLANDCKTPEKIQAVKDSGINDSNTYIGQHTTYNNTASEYFKNCNNGSIPQTTPTNFSKDEIQEIMNMTDNNTEIAKISKNGDFSGFDWSSQNPQTTDCQKLKKRAEDMQTNLNKQRDKVKKAAQIYRGIATDSVICDNSEGECTCVSDEDMEKERNGYEQCKTFSEYLGDLASCPLCPIFSVILTTDQEIAKIGWNALAKPLQKVILAFFSAYLAFITLKTIASPAGANPGAYLRAILGLGTKVAITYFLLEDGPMIYGNIVSPVVKGGLDMGLALLSIDDPGVEQCIGKAAVISNAAGGYLSNDLIGSIYNVTDCFSQSASRMPAVGRGLMCYGWENPTSTVNKVTNFLGIDITYPDFKMWLNGLIVFIFGIAIWMVIGFYLIDCTVQLGFVCVLIPIMIGCWPFKITSKYTTKGIETLINVFFVFALTGVMLVIGMKIIGYSAGGSSGTDLSTFETALNNNNVEELKKLTDLSGIELLVLIACCIFAFKLIGTINSIADQFSGGVGFDIGAKMGGTATSAATAVGKGAAHIAGKGAMTAGKMAADATGITAIADKAGAAVLSGASKAGKAVGLGKFQQPRQNRQQGMPGNANNNSNNNGTT